MNDCVPLQPTEKKKTKKKKKKRKRKKNSQGLAHSTVIAVPVVGCGCNL